VELSEKLDDNYSFCVQTAKDRYGLVLPYSKKENIPAIYYSPFKKAGDDIVATTLQDGSEIRFEIKKNDYGKWTVNEVSSLNFKS
jgi:hypothetical protein